MEKSHSLMMTVAQNMRQILGVDAGCPEARRIHDQRSLMGYERTNVFLLRPRAHLVGDESSASILGMPA